MKVELSMDTYRDKVYGCWIGKNAGGTVGGPLEKIFRLLSFGVFYKPLQNAHFRNLKRLLL